MKYVLLAAVGVVLLTALLAVVLAGCAARQNKPAASAPAKVDYTPITQQQAAAMMEQNDGHLVVDVRTPEEYAAGHIPGAVCVPYEIITDAPPNALPDKEQLLLVYCRSGRRSKQAAQKLAAMGYTRVYEFGGIQEWTGPVVTETAPRPTAMLVIQVGGQTFYAAPADNEPARALVKRLSAGPLTLTLQDYGGFEKVGQLPFTLPTADESITTRPGDVILYQGDHITLYYAPNTWPLTRLAHIEGQTTQDLLAVLGEGDVQATFSVEWSE